MEDIGWLPFILWAAFCIAMVVFSISDEKEWNDFQKIKDLDPENQPFRRYRF